MKRVAVLSLLLACLLALSAPVAAQTFGNEETLHKLQDVEIVGAENEALSLGYKTTTHNILLPYTITDDGYVLVVRDDSKKFYTMTAEEIAGWQDAGLLPDPLPPYEISLLDRIMGHLLYPTLVLIALLYLVPWLRKRNKAKAAANPTPPGDNPTMSGGNPPD